MSSANGARVPGGKGLASIDLKIGDYCISSSSFSIQDKAASISVQDYLKIDKRIFLQYLSWFCPVVQGF